MAAQTLKSGSDHARDVVNNHATLLDGLAAGTGLAAGAVSGAKIAAGSLGLAVATGGNAAGARTATGLAVGDKVVGVLSRGTDGTGNTNVTASFEATVTVVNQIQQTATDLTSHLLTVFVIKAA